MSKIIKVFPTEEELSLVSSHVRCSEENCSAVFKSTSNLNMHLIRHHKISSLELCKKDAVRQFYCPAQLCMYNKDSKKHFTKLKYLKQHFLKVHAAKNFICVEALLTHCKRKGHVSLNSNSNKPDKLNAQAEIPESKALKKPERLICPKLPSEVSYPIHHIAAIALSELSACCSTPKVIDKGIQTDYKTNFWKDFKKTSNAKIERKQNSSQTQTTGRAKNQKINTETQTNSEYLRNKLKSPSRVTSSKKRKKSMETQTKEFLNLNGENAGTFESNVSFCKDLDKETEKESRFYNSEMLVENLFQDVTSDFLKDNGENLNGENSQLDNLNNMSAKSIINRDELLNKRTKINPSPESTTKQNLFTDNGELNICNKEFETELNELNMTCKKLNNDNENLYLMEGGSYNVFDRLCNIETQTEIDNFLTECTDDSSFTLCSTTETQTIDFDPLLYSNMCTQTCDEVNQLFNFNFVDIETQTAWPDL
ncbi:UNVERIFIED_CONTAM: hypothetical protein PYX00_007958 [Menopon gallinae]|uniref:C2H2-type domain-containing protein n=1 Tax=Menopon gallinae TaxID=328185 RepID=A0AAW2HL28_9NEOP